MIQKTVIETTPKTSIIIIVMTENRAIVVKSQEKNRVSDLLTVIGETKKRTAIEGTIPQKKFLLEDTPSELTGKSIVSL
jgi:hypothetical protein